MTGSNVVSHTRLISVNTGYPNVLGDRIRNVITDRQPFPNPRPHFSRRRVGRGRLVENDPVLSPD